MKVTIVGAGVAGLALARALRGHEVEILEESPEMRVTGGSITLWPGSAAILERLGVDPLDRGVRLDTLGSYAWNGRRMLEVDLSVAERRYGHPSVHLSRRELVELLAEGQQVTYGARVERVDPARAEVFLADGRTVRADLLVGADGRRSAVRQALWGDDPARVTKWVSWQSFVDFPTGHESLMFTGRAGMVGIAPASPGRVLFWHEARSAPGRPLWADDPAPLAEVRRRLAGWADPVRSVLERVEELQFFPHYRHRIPDVWGSGPTTLAGDAAHSMPPAMAMGANAAIEDAWLLSRSLDDPRRYERERARVVRLSARIAGSELVNVHNPAAGLAPRGLGTRVFTGLLRKVSNYLLTPDQGHPTMSHIEQLGA
ncbi:MAG: FAD-dependent monooxygenase [Nonomuraea sp.]|nr:FAD-dependent monooxygenase [Nonomuraea sp.]